MTNGGRNFGHHHWVFIYFQVYKLGENNFNMRVIDFNHVLGKAAHCLHHKAAGFGRGLLSPRR